MKKEIKGKKTRIKNPLTYMDVRMRIENILKMALAEADIDKKILLIHNQFISAYPRILDNPAQAMLLEQLCTLCRDAELLHNGIYSADIDERQRDIRRKSYLNYIHEIGSILVKMGLTFCSQNYIPTDDRKSADPKAVSAIKKNIDDLRAKIQKQLPKNEEKIIDVEAEPQGNDQQ